jgi:hypothetical protein
VLGRAERDEIQTRAEYNREWNYNLGMTNPPLGPGDDRFLFVAFPDGRRVSEVAITP